MKIEVELVNGWTKQRLQDIETKDEGSKKMWDRKMWRDGSGKMEDVKDKCWSGAGQNKLVTAIDGKVKRIIEELRNC